MSSASDAIHLRVVSADLLVDPPVAVETPLAWHGDPVDLEIGRPDLLHRLFEAQVDARPDYVALSCGDERATYADVERAANQLATYLRQGGVGSGQFVGLWLPRSMDAYVALLAILKTGAAYVPLDPAYPADRVSHIAADCGMSALVSNRALADNLSSAIGTCRTVLLDEQRQQIFSGTPPRLTPEETGSVPQDVAYAIYTSGSTGRPKGVLIRHSNVVNLVRAEAKIFAVTPDDRVWQGFSLAFDASVEEVWLAFHAGATLVFSGKDGDSGPASARRLTEEQVTVLSCVPTLLAMFDDELPTVRLLILGGEACPPALVERWARPGRRLVNTYGPTEATVVATFVELQAHDPVTIGRPLANYCVYVVDQALSEVVPGEMGELVLGGLGIAAGYIGRAEETARRFVDNPFADTRDWSPRLYRTGDLVRFTPDGAIEFHGRADDQVKLRGFRIELSEIERAVLDLCDVRNAVVALREDLPGLQRLVCYVIPKQPSTFDPAACRRALAARLPKYMLPAVIEPLERFPQTTSGKVDRRSLPPPRERAMDADDAMAEYSPSQRLVATCWASLIGLPQVGLDEHFFLDLGGHSLLAARAISELRRNNGFCGLSVADLYQHSTVRGLVDFIEAENNNSAAETSAAPRDPTSAQNTEPVQNTPPHAHPSTARYLTCAAAQTVALYFIIGLFSLQWLAPYLTYTWFYDHGYPIPEALLFGFGSVLCTYPVMLCVAVLTKWLVLGRIRAGRYPLWGTYFFRWWFVRSVISTVPIGYLTGTPLFGWYLRAMGARVGSNALVDTDSIAAYDLISIGDDACLGNDSALVDHTIEDGLLIIGPVTIGPRAFVGTRAVVSRDCCLEADAALEDLSLLPPGTTIPAGERRRGSPARAVDEPSATSSPSAVRPSIARRMFFGTLAAASVFMFPILMLSALFPGVVVMNELNYADDYYFYLVASPLAACSYVLFLTLIIVGVKWLVVGRVRPGTHPIYGAFYYRKWFVDQLLNLSLDVLGTLYATMYLNPWYRLLGAKLDRDAEVSTASFISPDLLEIGEEGFIADNVSLGSARYENGQMTIAGVQLGRRAFIGNSALIPPGTSVGAGCLIGCLSAPPLDGSAARPETSWLGSPPMFLPRRSQSVAFGEETTYHPSRQLRLQRAFIEFFRIILPMTGFICGTSLLTSLVVVLREHFSKLTLLLLWPALYLTCGMAIVAVVIALKWLIMGRYHTCERPLWSRYVWCTELITGLHEQLACLFFVEKLTGTPWVNWYFRLLGARIGRRVYLDTTDLTEFDLVQLDDDAAINEYATLQTHLFEDRVMKTGRVEVGAGASVGTMSLVLYDTRIEAGAKLGDLSLLMKGESLPAGSTWAGAPARRVR
jgi:non-ribosomal peptide synthetase-like protein